MTIQITTIWERPTTDVQFWQAPEELKTLNSPLIASGDMTLTWSLSKEGLTLTQFTTFANEDVFNQVTTDPVRLAFRDERLKYNDVNGIKLISNDRV